jgi:hypothetical protein
LLITASSVSVLKARQDRHSVCDANYQIIPASVQRTMAERADFTIIKYDEGHVGLMTDPGTVTRVIERAAKASVR